MTMHDKKHTQQGTKSGTEGVIHFPLDASVIPAALLCDYYPVPCYRSCYLKKLLLAMLLAMLLLLLLLLLQNTGSE